MSDDKKKGDFDQCQREDEGGNKKADAKGESDSLTGDKQNAGMAGTSSAPPPSHAGESML